MQLLNWKPPSKPYERLLAALVKEVDVVWVVGGAVRDHLLHQTDSNSDLDVVIQQEAIPVARNFADKLGWAFYTMDPIRDIARLVFTANEGSSLVCDLSQIRGHTIVDDLYPRTIPLTPWLSSCEQQRGRSA